MLFNCRAAIFQNTSIIILFLLNIISFNLSFISGNDYPPKIKYHDTLRLGQRIRLCLLAIPDQTAFRPDTKKQPLQYNPSRPGTGKNPFHTKNILPERLTARVWCTKTLSSLLNIYFGLSRFQSSLILIYFSCGPNTSCSHAWHRTYSISGAPLSTQLRSIQQQFYCTQSRILQLFTSC